MPYPWEEIPTGSTKEFCLRVSAATLARVSFQHPQTGETMLALERQARPVQTHAPDALSITVQPFGGSARILWPDALRERIGIFRFDSLRSRAEQDFRILIRPEDWGIVKRACLDAFRGHGPTFLETDPAREMAEEFYDALSVELDPEQYKLRPLELVIESHPVNTRNLRALHLPTVRVYAIYEALLTSPALVERLLAASAQISSHDLSELARADAQRGGRGRANSVLVLPLGALVQAYLDLPLEKRGEPFAYAGITLEDNIPALFGEIGVPKYERFPITG